MSKKYPFTLIKEEIAKRKGKALDFAVGTTPYPLSDEMSDWIGENVQLALVPGTRADIAEFGQAAAAYLEREFGVEVDPGTVLPTSGGRAAMSVLAACTLSADDGVLVTEPGYPAFARLAAQRGANVIVSHLDADNDFAPDFDYDDAHPRASVSMISVNYPNNPTGGTLSGPVCRKLAELASEHAILFNDATYAPLVYNAKPRSLLDDEFQNSTDATLVELHCFSKLYPIGPQAASFMVGNAELLASLSTYSEYAWSPLSRFQLQATAKCLGDSARIEQFRTHIPPRLEALNATLTALGFKTYPSHSGSYLVSAVPTSIAGQAIDSATSAARLLMDLFDIAVVPLDTSGGSYLRFAALHRPADLDRLADLGDKLAIA